MKNRFLIAIFIFIIFGLIIIFGFLKQDSDKQFWVWFSKHQKDFYSNNIDESLYDALSNQLTKIDSNLTFEFSPIHVNGIKDIIISADGLKESFPTVKRLIGKAPKIDNWNIIAFRQRLPLEYNSVNYGQVKVFYDDIYFRYSKDSDKVGIELNIKDYIDNVDYNQAIYLLLDGLLGEYDVETKISWIERKKLKESDKEKMYRFVELRNIVDNLK